MTIKLSRNSAFLRLAFTDGDLPFKPGDGVSFRIEEQTIAFFLDLNSTNRVSVEGDLHLVRWNKRLPATRFGATKLIRCGGETTFFFPTDYKKGAVRSTRPSALVSPPMPSISSVVNTSAQRQDDTAILNLGFREKLTEAKNTINAAKRSLGSDMSISLGQNGELCITVIMDL